MFEVKPLETPETVPIDGGIMTLTHTCTKLQVDPRSPNKAIELTTLKGYLDRSGAFVDFGEHVVDALDSQGLADLLADTADGKPAGVFRTTDIEPAIEKQKAARRERADREAAASLAAKEEKDAVEKAAKDKEKADAEAAAAVVAEQAQSAPETVNPTPTKENA